MPKWIQFDLTGTPVATTLSEDAKQDIRTTRAEKLALEVQQSIARLDTLQDTLKLVSELCKAVSGVAYPIDLDERRRTRREHRQKQTEKNR